MLVILLHEGLDLLMPVSEIKDLTLQSAQDHHLVVPPLHQAEQTPHETKHYQNDQSIQ